MKGLDHVGFAVADLDRSIGFYRELLEREFDRLSHAGGAFRSDRPVDIPIGPYRGGRSAYLRDPDGISIQLLQPPAQGPSFAA